MLECSPVKQHAPQCSETLRILRRLGCLADEACLPDPFVEKEIQQPTLKISQDQVAEREGGTLTIWFINKADYNLRYPCLFWRCTGFQYHTSMQS